jgi:hypothetical protein
VPGAVPPSFAVLGTDIMHPLMLFSFCGLLRNFAASLVIFAASVVLHYITLVKPGPLHYH